MKFNFCRLGWIAKNPAIQFALPSDRETEPRSPFTKAGTQSERAGMIRQVIQPIWQNIHATEHTQAIGWHGKFIVNSSQCKFGTHFCLMCTASNLSFIGLTSCSARCLHDNMGVLIPYSSSSWWGYTTLSKCATT